MATDEVEHSLPVPAALCRLSQKTAASTLKAAMHRMKRLAAPVLAICCFCVGCHPPFQGGRLKKWRGPFFTTNYFAALQELDLNQDGQYQTTFSGFPGSPVYLDLALLAGNSTTYSLRQFRSHVTMELDKADGTPVCIATGELDQHRGVGNHIWVLASGGGEARFWNSDCSWLKIRRDQAYTLKIVVRGSNLALGTLRVRPIIWTPHD